MSPQRSDEPPTEGRENCARPPFPTESTRWSLVVAAGERSEPAAQQALETLCRIYWQPLYAFACRRVHDVHEAQDLTQEFFARLLERRTLALADPARGRFRSFLLTAFQNFLNNEWQKARAQKRGGDRLHFRLDFQDSGARYCAEPVERWSPEKLYERQWAVTLTRHVFGLLRDEYARKQKSALFETLSPLLSGAAAPGSLEEAAGRLEMTAGAVRTALHRLRARYGELLRHEIAQTVSSAAEIEAEIQALFAAF